MCPNIDDFNRGTALILGYLYQRFPVPAILKTSELDTHDDLLPEERERIQQRHVIYQAAVRFLADEGIIRFGSQATGQPLFAQAVLTSKGLSILQRTPEAIDGRRMQTVGDKLVRQGGELLQSGFKDVLRQVINVIFT